MKTNFTFTVLYWIFLNILIVACMDLALFMQTTLKPGASIYEKLFVSEFWATMEWLFLVPAQRLGNTFLNPAQLNLSSFVFDFLGQIVTNNFIDPSDSKSLAPINPIPCGPIITPEIISPIIAGIFNFRNTIGDNKMINKMVEKIKTGFFKGK